MFTKFEEKKKMLGPKSVICAAGISYAYSLKISQWIQIHESNNRHVTWSYYAECDPSCKEVWNRQYVHTYVVDRKPQGFLEGGSKSFIYSARERIYVRGLGWVLEGGSSLSGGWALEAMSEEVVTAPGWQRSMLSWCDSCAGPGSGLHDPCGSLSTQRILWNQHFYNPCPKGSRREI